MRQAPSQKAAKRSVCAMNEPHFFCLLPKSNPTVTQEMEADLCQAKDRVELSPPKGRRAMLHTPKKNLTVQSPDKGEIARKLPATRLSWQINSGLALEIETCGYSTVRTQPRHIDTQMRL